MDCKREGTSSGETWGVEIKSNLDYKGSCQIESSTSTTTSTWWNLKD